MDDVDEEEEEDLPAMGGCFPIVASFIQSHLVERTNHLPIIIMIA